MIPKTAIAASKGKTYDCSAPVSGIVPLLVVLVGVVDGVDEGCVALGVELGVFVVLGVELDVTVAEGLLPVPLEIFTV